VDSVTNFRCGVIASNQFLAVVRRQPAQTDFTFLGPRVLTGAGLFFACHPILRRGVTNHLRGRRATLQDGAVPCGF
jgi:hypothetical protein